MYTQTKLISRLVIALACSNILATNALAAPSDTNLTLVNGAAFLYADNIVAGISSDGTFGTTVPASEGPFPGTIIGFISDPSRENFIGPEGYDGDFFMPGTREEGWGVTVNETNYNNNNSDIQGNQISGNLENYVKKSRYMSVDWSGSVAGLEIKKRYRTYDLGLAIIMDVELKNSTSSTMENIYYMRTVDPDNNQSNPDKPTYTYVTNNSIVQQGELGTASVQATQIDNSIITLSAYTKRARVAHGGGRQVRDPVSVYEGTNGLNSSGSLTEDASISTAVKFDTLLPGEKVQFTISYALAPLDAPIIQLDENNSSELGYGNFKQLYELGSEALPLADTDVVISSSANNTFDGLKIKITNPHEGDNLSILNTLPSSIVIDDDEPNHSTEINLKGSASAATYIEAIKAIRFDNQNLNTNLATREINIQVLDEVLSLSNSSEARIFITVPLVLNTPISTDNYLSGNELTQGLLVSGTTAPNSNLLVTLTDIAGESITATTAASNTGVWEVTLPNSDLSQLSDGSLTVTAQSTDENTNVITESTSLIKDTTVPLAFTKPLDQSLIHSTTVLIEGTSEANATVNVSTNDGQNCNTTVNSEGLWSCEITDLTKGQTYQVSAVSTDALDNTATASMAISVSNLTLNVTSPLDGSTVDDGTPLIIGTTEPNIDITITSPNGDECKTTSDENGNWSCHLDEMPVGGPHNISIAGSNPSNGAQTSEQLSISIPDRPLIISSPANNIVVTQAPLVIMGTANPNATVVVSDSNGEICTTLTDSQGNWSCNHDKVLSGDHEIIVSTIKVDGSQEELTTAYRVEIDDGSVETILEGGGGSWSYLLSFFLLLILITKFTRNYVKQPKG